MLEQRAARAGDRCGTDRGVPRPWCRPTTPAATASRTDPALPMPAWPVLQPIRALAAAAEGDEMRFARVGALRACNRMQHAITEAIRALSNPA